MYAILQKSCVNVKHNEGDYVISVVFDNARTLPICGEDMLVAPRSDIRVYYKEDDITEEVFLGSSATPCTVENLRIAYEYVNGRSKPENYEISEVDVAARNIATAASNIIYSKDISSLDKSSLLSKLSIELMQKACEVLRA